MKNGFYILLVTLVLTACGGSKEVVDTNPKPDWITSRPVDVNYYIGVGIASKSIHPADYASQAKKHALNEMASEIKVNVASNSMLFSFENNNKFQDEFKSFTKLSTNELIENFEQVAIWENKDEYWVYYRLSKAQYQKDKQTRIDKAVSESIESVKRAEELENQGVYTKALFTLFQAVEPIKPYLGESLETDMNGEKVYLGNHIASQIAEIVSHFSLRAEKSSITTVWGKGLSTSDLAFKLTDDKGNTVENMPLLFKYSHGIIRPKNALTDQNGQASSSITKIKKPIKSQWFKVKVDFVQLFLEGKEVDPFTENLLSQFSTPEAEVRIDVNAPTVHITTNEKRNGKKTKEKAIKVAASEALTKKGFKIVERTKDADLYIKINADTRKNGNANGLYNCVATGYVSVIDAETKKELYAEEIKDVKGVKSNYDAASVQAMNKAAERVGRRIVPKFYRNYMK